MKPLVENIFDFKTSKRAKAITSLITHPSTFLGFCMNNVAQYLKISSNIYLRENKSF